MNAVVFVFCSWCTITLTWALTAVAGSTTNTISSSPSHGSTTAEIGSNTDRNRFNRPKLKSWFGFDEEPIKSDDIKFYFYSQTEPPAGCRRYVTQVDHINYLGFFNSHATRFVFLVHGWKNDYKSAINTELVPVLLKIDDYQVIVVDWSPLSSAEYYIPSRMRVPEVGRYVADFIQKMTQMFGIDVRRILLIGHSLGAHVCGFIGKTLHNIQHIIALDPAGPGFSARDVDDRLNKNDAVYVEAIHTSLVYGANYSVGNVDFYPNGGVQEHLDECREGLDPFKACSHRMAYMFLAEQLMALYNTHYPVFYGRLCISFAAFERGACDTNPILQMGKIQLDKYYEGDYYFHTKLTSPYSDAMRGANVEIDSHAEPKKELVSSELYGQANITLNELRSTTTAKYSRNHND